LISPPRTPPTPTLFPYTTLFRSPAEYGGHDASNLEMAIIREHLATKGLGLHNDLQNESSIVGNFPTVLMMRDFGTEEQKADWMRSEEHTSELQSRFDLVCRLLLE